MVALAACESPTDPGLPAGAVRFDPPSIYERWWSFTRECSARTGDMSTVSFYVVPGVATFPTGDGHDAAGMWQPDARRIVIAGLSQLRGDVVRHEMLHALLDVSGHPRGFFIQKCGGVVVCVLNCLTDAGIAPLPPSGAVTIDPSDLTVSVSVDPPNPGSSIDDGFFTMTVTATNTRPTPVIIGLMPSGSNGMGVSFSYKLDRPQGSVMYDVQPPYPEDRWFEVGETKRFLFDFRNRSGGTRYDLTPGTYTFNGAFMRTWASNPPVIAVAP